MSTYLHSRSCCIIDNLGRKSSSTWADAKTGDHDVPFHASKHPYTNRWKWTRTFLDYVENQTPGLRIEKNINEILKEGGVDDQSISSLIWSHFHWDHIGDASLFPSSTEIVVGPSFKESFMPGYPTRQDSPLLHSDFA